MAEKLVDVDETYSLWRYRHLKVVMRIIGQKAGHRRDGRRGLPPWPDRRGLLPELWEARTALRERQG
jgi:tryptophan 2,3-dioxygenase